MMPIVPPTPKRAVPGQTVHLSAETQERLRLYALFCGASSDKVITVALHRLFEQQSAVAPWYVAPVATKARRSRTAESRPATTDISSKR